MLISFRCGLEMSRSSEDHQFLAQTGFYAVGATKACNLSNVILLAWYKGD